MNNEQESPRVTETDNEQFKAANQFPEEQPQTVSSSQPPVNSSPKKSSFFKKLALSALALALLGLAAGGAFFMQQEKIDELEATKVSLNTEVADLASTDYELPAGTVPAGDCVPGMGIHNLVKGGDTEYGPFVLTSKSGKVLGMEFMISDDMFKKIPNANPPVSIIPADSPMYGWKYNHTEFSQLVDGHPQFERNHIDVHMYTVDKQAVMDACK